MPGVAKKPAEVTKEAAHDALQPPTDPKDPPKENEAPQNIKEDLKGKGLAFVPVETAKSTKATGKANSPLKIN